jgi:branched-chain amino acid transport system ATP-binding protein
MLDVTASPPVVNAETVLSVTDLQGWYGESLALRGMQFDVPKGGIVTLLGRNGAGKTTTLRAIMGLLGRRTGSIKLMGKETIGLASNEIARLGIAYCPEERGIFASLSVEENLTLPPIIQPGGMTNDEIFTLFPNLKERLKSQGTKLSGGEQQMLAIARILRTGSKFILLDEPTEGLAPVIVQQIGHMIRKLKTLGYTIILVEQNFHFAATVADRHVVVEQGRVVDTIDNADLANNMEKLHAYLGV